MFPILSFVTVANLQLELHCTEHLNNNSKKPKSNKLKLYSHVCYIVIKND